MSTLYERDEASIAGIEKLRFFPLEVVSGHGSTLVTPDGRELLDLSATWTASGLGHGHPAVVEAVSRAVRTAPGAGGLSAVHPDSVGLAEDLLALVPGTGERRVYLGHAGSDACDVALRACRHATGKRTVVAFEHSYHGGVGVAMGVSGVQRADRATWGQKAALCMPALPAVQLQVGGCFRRAAVSQFLHSVQGRDDPWRVVLCGPHVSVR